MIDGYYNGAPFRGIMPIVGASMGIAALEPTPNTHVIQLPIGLLECTNRRGRY